MLGIREEVRRLVNQWWNSATPEQRYTKPCPVSVDDVLRSAGISRYGCKWETLKQTRDLLAARVHRLQQESVQDANDLA